MDKEFGCKLKKILCKYMLTDCHFCRFTLLLGPCLPGHKNSPSVFKVRQNLYRVGGKLILLTVSNISINLERVESVFWFCMLMRFGKCFLFLV